MRHTSFLIPFVLLFLQAGLSDRAHVVAATPLRVVPVASGFTHPLFVTSPPADSTRLFVVEKGGLIRIVKSGMALPQPFLDINTKVLSTGPEQGLLGLAFHPRYRTNRYFYVNYTRQGDGATVVSRFQASATSPDSAVPNSESIVLTVLQPHANHNGGMMAFGPDDGYLYIGMGDGGSSGDPGNRAQDTAELLGKILRIDVDKRNGTLVPPGNPGVGRPGWRGEIWAYGLRNPWRFSFDRGTGNLYIGDVGQNSWEEINVQLRSSRGGEDYGWRLKEGNHCYNPPSNCESGKTLVDPIFEYDHSSGCSVTGGYVYRGCAIRDLQGSYFFGDFCSGEIWSLTHTGEQVTVQDRTAELGLGSILLSSFGEDAQGELYIVDYGGSIYKIVPEGEPSSCVSASCCIGTTGDVDGSGLVDLADLNAMVSYLVGSAGEPPCVDEVNIDGFGIVDLTDLSILLAYLTDHIDELPGCQ